MPTEREKMISGQLYSASDPELASARLRARQLVARSNNSAPDDAALRRQLAKELFGQIGKNFTLEPPFHCDYGANITFGENIFINFNCTILDVAPVTIGRDTMFGPNVQIYTATHPLDAAERRSGLEAGQPITIGRDVWLGGGVIINPGVTIGDRSVIGSGSVVTADVPPDVFAAGNPCRVIRVLK